MSEEKEETGLKKLDVNIANIQAMPMEQLATIILESKLAPAALDSTSKIIVAMTMGKELGFREISSLNYIHVIEGKPTLSVHAMSALIKKIGIEYQLIEDAVYVYPEGTSMEYLPVMVNGEPKTDESGKVVLRKPSDVRTTIEFLRPYHGQILKDRISFTRKEAAQQFLLDKPNWKKMFKIMMRARCLALGARFVAPQVFAGTYETSEILDSKNINYTVDEEGEVIDIEGK